MPQLPDVPTVAETVPGFQAVSWFGLVGPAGMPPDVVAKINAEVRGMFADPEFQKTFLDHYLFQSIAGSPDDLMNFIKSEEPKWRKVIQRRQDQGGVMSDDKERDAELQKFRDSYVELFGTLAARCRPAASSSPARSIRSSCAPPRSFARRRSTTRPST